MRILQNGDDVFRESSEGFGTDCFKLEKINRCLIDLLIRFAEDVGDSDIATKLESIRSGGDGKWHERWLEDYPWVRELFFRYFLIGERAITEAECYLLEDGSDYAQSFAAALKDCIECVKNHHCSGEITASQAIESILQRVSEKVKSTGYSVEGKNRDHVPLRIVQRYAMGAQREDQLHDLAGAIDSYLACCKDRVADYAFRESVLGALATQKSIYQGAYSELKDLPGGYQKVADSKRTDAIPDDFERNLAMIGCADAVARYEIEKRFKEVLTAREGEESGIVKALSGNLTARQTDWVFRKDNRLPGGMASRIVSYKLLSWLFREWVRKATWVANYDYQGDAKPINAGGRVSRTWGPIDQMPEGLHEYLNWFSGVVVQKLRGWGDSRIKNCGKKSDGCGQDVDYDSLLSQWVESRTDAQGPDRTNVPLIRFLDGGVTFKNLKEVVDNYVHGLLSKNIIDRNSEFGRQPISVDEPAKGDGGEDEGGRAIIDTIVDDRWRKVYTSGEVDDMQLRVYEMLASHDRRLAVYFGLVRFGPMDFVLQNVDKEGKEMLKGLSEDDKVSESDALRIIGESSTNTNWFKRNMMNFIMSNPGRVEELFGVDSARFINQFR